MTTIAATTRMMAADSRCTVSATRSKGDRHFPTTKLLRANGVIAGAAGRAEDCSAFIRWATEGGRPPKFLDDFEGLLLSHKGLFLVLDDAESEIIKDGFYAIGSGADLAMGAMILQRRRGIEMNPREAVECACERDADSAPPVDFLTLRRARPRRS